MIDDLIPVRVTAGIYVPWYLRGLALVVNYVQLLLMLVLIFAAIHYGWSLV